MKEIKEEIILLTKKINQWNEEYFDKNLPSVSDRVYDTNLRRLSNLEKEYPNYLQINSPTKNIGSNLINKFDKIIHKEKMLSLDKVYSKEEIEKFINDICKIVNKDAMFYIEPKIDGLSISLHYKNGKLSKAITRGDGSTGEDVTDNVFNIIKDIPSSINYINDIEIRGEIFISKSDFIKINENDLKFSNPRNMASGTLRQINKKIVLERKLSCFVYEVISPQIHLINTYSDSILFLEKNGFKVIKQKFLTNNNINKIMDYINEFSKKRDELNFEVDGLVIKLNDVSFYNEIGFTTKFPKYNVAYKFDDELVETKLKKIKITIGRTGMVTYNAELEPVLLKGSVISAATLHNFNYINNLNVNIGDDVLLKKAGEIIPKVFSLSKKNNTETFQKILICPFCNHKLIDNKLYTDQFCLNNICPEINIRKIIHFVSRKGMNITGLGESWIRIFYKLGIINKYPDIYLLHKKIDEIKSIDRIGNKSLGNLIRSIEKSKKNNLPSVIFSLGIDHVGERNCKLIAYEIGVFENFISFDFEKLNEIKDIGPITVKSLILFQSEIDNLNNIKELINSGINPIFEKAITNTNNFFSNKIFVITGKFSKTRNEIKEIIENNGGKFSTIISSKTDYLICGIDSGNKRQKAEEQNIKIIFEEGLTEIIKQL